MGQLLGFQTFIADFFHIGFFVLEMCLCVLFQFFQYLHDLVVLIRQKFLFHKVIGFFDDPEQSGVFFIHQRNVGFIFTGKSKRRLFFCLGHGADHDVTSQDMVIQPFCQVLHKICQDVPALLFTSSGQLDAFNLCGKFLMFFFLSRKFRILYRFHISLFVGKMLSGVASQMVHDIGHNLFRCHFLIKQFLCFIDQAKQFLMLLINFLDAQPAILCKCIHSNLPAFLLGFIFL